MPDNWWTRSWENSCAIKAMGEKEDIAMPSSRIQDRIRERQAFTPEIHTNGNEDSDLLREAADRIDALEGFARLVVTSVERQYDPPLVAISLADAGRKALEGGA